VVFFAMVLVSHFLLRCLFLNGHTERNSTCQTIGEEALTEVAT